MNFPSVAFTLAQVPASSNASAPAPLNAPPFLAHYFFENPIPAAAIGLALAAGCGWWVLTGRAKGNRWLGWVAIAVAMASLGIFFASRAITTERERLITMTREVIAHAVRADTVELQPMLASEVTFTLLGNESPFNRAQLLALVAKYPGQVTPIDWHKTSNLQAALQGGTFATTQVHVRVGSKETTMYDVPVGSWWRLTWRRSGSNTASSEMGAWVVTSLECLQIDGVPAGTNVQP